MTTPTVTATPAEAAGASEPFVAALGRHRVVAVIRHRNADAAREIARACIAGGLGLVEITLTTPDAPALIADLAGDAPEHVLIGAGTVLDVGQLHAVVDAGARFLVSPATDLDVMAAAGAVGVPFVPGAATPTEVALGARHGAAAVKLFPAGVLGLPFLKAVRAVMPHVPLLPSGGIGVAELPAWVAAGALAVAIGSELDAAHARGGADAVTALAATAVQRADATSSTQDPQRAGTPS